MGQKYKIINKTTREQIHFFIYDEIKNLCWVESECSSYLFSLMMGEWNKDEIFILGSYATSKNVKTKEEKAVLSALEKEFSVNIEAGETLYLVSENWKDRKEDTNCSNKYRYILNTKLGQYIDLEHCPIEKCFLGYDDKVKTACVSPFILLLTIGNGLDEETDYKGNNAQYAGKWITSTKYISFISYMPDSSFKEIQLDMHYAYKVIPHEKKEEATKQYSEKVNLILKDVENVYSRLAKILLWKKPKNIEDYEEIIYDIFSDYPHLIMFKEQFMDLYSVLRLGRVKKYKAHFIKEIKEAL